MKNLKISAKIWLGFLCLLIFLLAIAVTTIISSLHTGANIDEVDIYVGMQNSANELIHILNETRITAAGFYAAHSAEAYSDISKQLTYCDFRLKKLYEYLNAHAELAGLRSDIEEFDKLYSQWREGIKGLGAAYNLEADFSEQEQADFAATCGQLRRVNLLAHEVLSNTIADIEFYSNQKTADTKGFHTVALRIVFIISGVSLICAVLFSLVIIRSIMPPISNMRDVLKQLGQTGNLQIPAETREKLLTTARGRDETAQCTAELLVLMERLDSIDKLLSYVADGDLTVEVALQSKQDTMGLAVEKMLQNFNQKFRTIAQSTNWVKQKAVELSNGSSLLADGSQSQAESVEHLSGSVALIVDKIKKNTHLAEQAAGLADNIQANAASGTEQMNQMTQAALDINAASQSIARVIKVIDDIAFQTNILALNAAVEAARAGQHGKGFSVVAEEVRNLATKSAAAAKDTGVMIEDTIQKAALGASIAEATSESLEKIVQGVKRSSVLIGEITMLSQEQSEDIQQIISDVEHVEKIVHQNSSIASQSADAAGEISDQSKMLNDLVEQFQLLNDPLAEAQHKLAGRY